MVLKYVDDAEVVDKKMKTEDKKNNKEKANNVEKEKQERDAWWRHKEGKGWN